jgi:homogentisate 1,2-dioxygenase
MHHLQRGRTVTVTSTLDHAVGAIRYQSGFGNQFSTEAVEGALPIGRNSPQRAPLGLVAELISGSAFTAPRELNLRTWMYRRSPSAMHGPARRIADGLWRASPFVEAETPPDRMRWDPWRIPAAPTDFVEGIVTIAGNGDVHAQTGVAVHVYAANRSMQRRYLSNADGELLIVPQTGALRLHTVVIFPPRWLVAEDSFRPPWFHRNVMSELMGLVHGEYDAKAEGFVPGGMSLHNCMQPHGPDAATFERASRAKLEPQKLEGTLAFMFESRHVFRPTPEALAAPNRQTGYDAVWSGFRPAAA